MNQIQHALRDRPWRLQRQAVALIALGIFIAIFIGALYLAQSASVSTLGRQLEELIARRNQLEQQNESNRNDSRKKFKLVVQQDTCRRLQDGKGQYKKCAG